MRKILYFSIAALALISMVSCEKDTLDYDHSVITVDKVEKNKFDLWLDDNFLRPYNIDFKYRFEMNESDMNYFTIPADFDQAIEIAHLVKYLCVDTYDEVAGIEFTRGYFPKMFFLIGEFEYRNNGTMILGTAEGGKKILLSGINYLDYFLAQGADALNEYYIKTIHHEFTHILNQTKSYSADFKQVNGDGYVSDSWSEPPYNTEYLKNGFISAYAQHSDREDFAEMSSIYVTNSKDYWDAQIKAAGDGAEFIEAKLDLVKAYFKEAWAIDLDQLRDVILRRENDVVKGKVDLTNLDIR